MRKIKLQFLLVGKSYTKLYKEKSDKIYTVIDQVTDQFGNRPLFTVDEIDIPYSSNYPDFYAAGWFISDKPIIDTDGIASELVIVAHGHSMASAKEHLIKAAATSAWDTLATNIQPFEIEKEYSSEI